MLGVVCPPGLQRYVPPKVEGVAVSVVDAPGHIDALLMLTVGGGGGGGVVKHTVKVPGVSYDAFVNMRMR